MPGLFGLGGNRAQIHNFEQKKDAFEYGGAAHGAQNAAGNFANKAAAADGRQGAQIDQAQFQQDRGLQKQAYGQLAGLANGTGPSLAAAQGQVQQQQARNAMASGARSAVGGGGNLASANRAAMLGNAQAQGGIANGTMMARQAEQVGAINSMGGLATGMAGQSADIAKSQAGFQQNQNQLNDHRALGYDQMGVDVNKAQLDAQLKQQELAQNAQFKQQEQASQQAQQNQENNAGLFKAAGSAVNQGMGAIGGLFSDERLKQNVQPMGGAPGTMDDYNSRPGRPENRGSLSGELNNAGYKGSPGEGSTGTDQSIRANVLTHAGDGSPGLGGDEGNAKLHATKKYYGTGDSRYGDIAFGDNAAYVRNAGGTSSLEGGGVGSEAGATSSNSSKWLKSDEKNKKLSGLAGHPSAEMTRNLEGVTYEYKPEAQKRQEDVGTQFGITTQQLKKSPMGASLVTPTPQGEQVDIPKATGALLATVAHQQKQLDALHGAAKGSVGSERKQIEAAYPPGRGGSMNEYEKRRAIEESDPARAHAYRNYEATRESRETSVDGGANYAVSGLPDAVSSDPTRRTVAGLEAGAMLQRGTPSRAPYAVDRPAPTEQGVVDDVNLAIKDRNENRASSRLTGWNPTDAHNRKEESSRMQAAADVRASDDKMVGYKTSMTDQERIDMYDRQRALDGLRGGKGKK